MISCLSHQSVYFKTMMILSEMNPMHSKKFYFLLNFPCDATKIILNHISNDGNSTDTHLYIGMLSSYRINKKKPKVQQIKKNEHELMTINSFFIISLHVQKLQLFEQDCIDTLLVLTLSTIYIPENELNTTDAE